MKEFWNTIQLIFTAIGGWLGYFLGGCDGLLIALVAFVAIDYITGVMCAVADKKLSSEVGFKGICRKVLIFLLVGIANILDVQVIGTGSVLRTAVIFFYISNEGVESIASSSAKANSSSQLSSSGSETGGSSVLRISFSILLYALISSFCSLVAPFGSSASTTGARYTAFSSRCSFTKQLTLFTASSYAFLRWEESPVRAYRSM